MSHCPFHLKFRLSAHVRSSGRIWALCMDKMPVLNPHTGSGACFPHGWSLDWRSGLSHKPLYVEPHILGCLHPWTPWLCLKFFSSPGEGRAVQGPCSEPDKPYWRLPRRRTDETSLLLEGPSRKHRRTVLCARTWFGQERLFSKR